MIDLLAAKRSCTPMGNRYYGSSGGKSQTTYTQNMPKELVPYAIRTAETGWEAMNKPYEAYGGQRVADPSGMQQSAWDRAGNQQMPGQIGAASNIAYGVTQGPSGFGQQGYGLMGQAAGMTGQAGQQYAPGQGYAMDQLLQGAQPNAQYQAGLGGIQGAMGGSTTGSFLDPGVAQAHMDPYQQNVTDITKRQAVSEAANIANSQRAQTGMAGGVGGIGGYRDQLLQSQGNKNLTTNLSDIQARGSEAAYQNAQQLYGTEEQRRLQAAQQRGTLGGTLAQQALAGQGQQAANYQAYLQGAQGIGGQELQRAGQMGQLGGQMSEQARAQQALGLQGAQALGQLGGQQFDIQRGITSDLSKYGQEQRQMEQAKLDTAYQDFLTQQDWQKNALNWYNQLLHGGNISSSSMYSQPGPNPLAQAAGGGLSAAAIYSMLNK